MPVPTRAAYYSANWAECAAANTRRFDGTRAHFGHVLVRVVPQIRMCPERPDQYGALLGHAFTLRVDEPADVVVSVTEQDGAGRTHRTPGGPMSGAAPTEIARATTPTTASVAAAPA